MINIQKLFFEQGHEEAIRFLSEELAIKVKDYGDYFLLDYNQIDSPKTNEYVVECRGLTVDKNGRILARAFPRFFNWGEAPETTVGFEFSRAKVMEKADGSLIKVYFNPYTGRWEIGTRGTALAEGPHDFYESFRHAVLEDGFGVTEEEFQRFFNHNIAIDSTYVFEYTSPKNRIVTRYTKPEMVLLGINDNVNCGFRLPTELDIAMLYEFSDNVRSVKLYSYDSVDEMLESTNDLPNLEEGYVLYDMESGVRIKVKSLKYVEVHRIRGEGKPTPKSICTLILENEQDEFLAYFPEFRDLFTPYEDKLKEIHLTLVQAWDAYKDLESQKDFALAVKDLTGSSILFTMRNKKISLHDAWNEAKLSYKLTMLIEG